MAFVTFVFYQAFTLLIVRHPTRSVFTREALENSSAFIATGAVVVMLIFVVQLNALHGFLTTTDLTPANGWPAQRSARPSCGSSSS
jgi:Ca2+-transporting ATPase